MDNEFKRLADIEVEAVRPDVQGFTLTGQGGAPDHAEYRLDVHFDLPIDARTRAVLGELLSHSGLTISRRGSEPAGPSRRRDRAHQA